MSSVDIADSVQDLEEPQKRGQATEAVLKAVLLARDIPVLVPEYDNEPYDFVVELDGSFYTVQAKAAYPGPGDGTVRFETVSTRRRGDGYDRSGYEDTVDLFLVFNPGRSEVYAVRTEEAAEGKMEIRFAEPANNQRVGVNWYEEYLLDAVLPDFR